MPQGYTDIDLTPDMGFQDIDLGTPASVDVPSQTQLEPDSWGRWIREHASSLGISPATTETAIGAGKSVLGTIKGGADLIRQIPGVGPALERGPAYDFKTPITLEPQDTAQRVGKTAADIGQFMLPASSLAKVKAALKTGSGLLNALVGAGVEGASAGAIGSAQTGDLGKGAVTGAVTAGTTLGAQAALASLKPLAERIERALVKPQQADMRDGFKTANIFKHQLGGTLEQSYDKTQQAIDRASKQLQAVMRADPDAKVNVYEALFQAADDLDKSALKNVADQQGIQRALNSMLENTGEAMRLQGIPVGPDGSVPLTAANLLKQGVGDAGAWLHTPSGKTVADIDAAAKEKVANAFYDRLKVAIEANAKGPVKAINQQLSELIPIKRALIRRIPVAARQNVVNLGDMFGWSTGSWGLALANRLLRSGPVAQGAYELGQQAGPASVGLGRTAGALTTEGQ